MKDRIKTENIEIQYCPTGVMVADFFTKPLQGNLFKKFRDVIQGYKHMNTLRDFQDEETPSQERVRNGESEDSTLEK